MENRHAVPGRQSYPGHGARFDVDDASITKVSGSVAATAFGHGTSVPLTSVTGLRYKPASLLVNGYLQVLTAESPDAKPTASDPATVLFTRKKQPHFEQLRDWLSTVVRINRSQLGNRPDHPTATPSPLSPSDIATSTATQPLGHNPADADPVGDPDDYRHQQPPSAVTHQTQPLSRSTTADPGSHGPSQVSPAGATAPSHEAAARTDERTTHPKRQSASRTSSHYLPVQDLEVVGESYYAPAFAKLFAAASKPLGGQIWRDAELVAEPNNPYDRQAVAVRIGGHIVGYIPAELAPNIQPKILRANKNRHSVAVPARVWARCEDREWWARVTLDPTEQREPDWRYVDRAAWPGRVSPDRTERLTDSGLWRQIEARETAKLVEGRDFETLRPDIAQARADGDTTLALSLLEKCIAAAETSAAIVFSRPTLWPTEQAAIIHRSLKNYDAEVAVLERFLDADPDHCGTKGLQTRLARARQLAGKPTVGQPPQPTTVVDNTHSAPTVLHNLLPVADVMIPQPAELAHEKNFMDTIHTVLDSAHVPPGEALHTFAIVRELPHAPRGRGLIATYIDHLLVGYVGSLESDIVRDVIRRDEYSGRDCRIRCRVFLAKGTRPHARITLGPYEQVIAHQDETEAAARARQSADEQAQLRLNRLAAGGREAADQRRRLVRDKDFTEWVETVNDFKRAKRFDDALNLVLECIDAAERDAQHHGYAPPPWYTEQAAILYRKSGDVHAEVAILKRYQATCPRGLSSTRIAERLVKARIQL
jgi:hypothetical protein